MERWVTVVAVVVGLMWCGVAHAEEEPEVIYRRHTVHSFDDDTVDGNLASPDVGAINARKTQNHRSLIMVRESFRKQLLDAVHIDRLNVGPVPTIKLNWLQPHEGNIIDFLFRARAYQEA